jgi:signal transduction histidine kinase
MHTGATQMVVTIERRALFGLADATLAERLNRETERFAGFGPVAIASDLAELRRQSASFSPRVILLDEQILAGAPLVESLRQLSEAAPLILVAGMARQSEIAGLVARRLRWAERSETPLGAPWSGFSAETAEIFRHEINSPLTGILGNAELVLSHRGRLAPADVHRLQTVVDLAVRLRETTRRLSNALEAGRIR